MALCASLNKHKQEPVPVGRLVRVARGHYERDVEVKVAVLQAWAKVTNLARWTPEMVDVVEREMAR